MGKFPERGTYDMSVPGVPVLKVWPQELHTILNIAFLAVPESTIPSLFATCTSAHTLFVVGCTRKVCSLSQIMPCMEA